ncbi:porin [Curvibacter sp. APW13]|uniref:porin n=1 Tax=Curvibacter sp. APW13 TaxID=3077236 RepID=UPI0028DF66A1|nr:porin [Curvibacter sp. APW13]MDT8992547.1 porin [Curvibacter sp. APW13]
MNKSIVALAVLAFSSASFAQVSITGSLAMGYKASKASNRNAFAATGTTYAGGAESAGLGVDTSQINVTAKEDLGGGQTVEANMAFAGADRSGESNTTSSGAVTGRDATLSYTNTSFGRIQMGSTEGAAVHAGIPSADAPVIDMDGKLFQIKSSSDFISYAAPIGPVIFIYKLSESSASKGLGLGFQGNAGASAVGQRTSDVALAYSSGAMEIVGAYRSYDNTNKTSITTADSLTKDNVYNFQFGYDAGFAKFGVGYQQATASVGPKVQDILLGASFPMGAWTFGATYALSTVSGVADTPLSAFSGSATLKSIMQQADGSANGFSLGAKYNLSKRTNVLVRYASWVKSGYEQFESFDGAAFNGGDMTQAGKFGYGDRASETSILLVHNF